MGRLSLATLGAVEIKLDGESVTGIKTDKVRALLVYLAVECDRHHRRQSLAGLLWPDFPETKARTNLRHALSNLRKALGEDQNDPSFLIVERETMQFNPESDYWLDIRELEAVSGSTEPTINDLETSIDLYHGPFLEGFSLRDCPEFDNWTAITRQRCQGLFSDVLGRLVEDHADQDEYKQAIDYARRWLEVVPWEEGAHRALMRLLALTGQRVAALAQFEACKLGLAEELGVDPSVETVQLYEQIRDGELAANERGRRRGVLPVRLTSFVGREKEIEQVTALLESHRLVTITGPGGIGKTRLALQVARGLEGHFKDGAWWVELTPVSDPDLVSETVVRSLGIHLESRENALSSLQYYLEDRHLLLVLDNCEYLIEACAHLADTLLRACPNLTILATSREVIGIQGESIYNLPPMTFPKEDEIPEQNILRGNEAFKLFVDRVQTVSTEFDVTTGNTPTIIQICQQLDGIPLAIELAAARTRMMGLGEIAQRLEDRFRLLTGGSRTALPRHQTLRACIDWSYEMLSREERTLLQRLSVFAGQWTLDAAQHVGCGDGIETYQVLDLLGELANKSLVTMVQEEDVGTCYRILETIRQYANEKLVESGGLPATRDRHLSYYVDLVERLEKEIRGPEQGVLLRRLEAELDDIRLAMAWSLQDEGDQNWKIEYGMRLGSALLWFWHIRCREEEGYYWLEQLLDRGFEKTPDPFIETSAFQTVKMVRAKALMVASWLSRRSGRQFGQRQKIGDMLTESRDLYLELGLAGRLGYACVLHYMAVIDWADGKPDQAEDYIRESLMIFQEEGDIFWQSQALCILAELASVNHEFDQASLYFGSALVLSREIGDLDGIAYHLFQLAELTIFQTQAMDDLKLVEQTRVQLGESLENFLKGENISAAYLPMGMLGTLDWRQGNYQRASIYYQQALSCCEKHGIYTTIDDCIHDLGTLALSQGDCQRAAEFFNRRLALSLKRDRKGITAASLHDMGDLDWELDDYDVAARKYETALGISKDIDSPQLELRSMIRMGRISLAKGEYHLARGYLKDGLKLSKKLMYHILNYSLLEMFAILAFCTDEPEQAARLLGVTNDWHTGWLYTRSPKERREREQAIEITRQTLGEAAFAAAWDQGIAMTLDEAVEYALGGDKA